MSSVEKAHPPDAPWNIVDPSNGTNASTTPDRVALAAHRVGLVPKWGIVSAIKRLFKKNVPPPQQFMSFDDKVAATFVQNALSGIRLSGRPRLKTADLKKLARGLASGGKGLIREKTVQLVAEEKTNARGESMLVVRPKPYKKGERLTEKQYVITKVLPQQIHGIAGVNVHKDRR